MKDEENRLINQAMKWGAKASEVIREVGGSPVVVLNQFSPDSISIMVRNGIQLKAER